MSTRTFYHLHLLFCNFASSLIAAFKAPDWEPSQDDSHVELDEEDVQWRAWLDELMHGVPPAVSDSGDIEEDDQDYNFLADQGLCLEEVEEYRNDKAVKIPGWLEGGDEWVHTYTTAVW